MTALLLIALAGFGAQFVDGSLGMGYGVTSSTLLIAIGLAPAAASASVHLAELGTTAASLRHDGDFPGAQKYRQDQQRKSGRSPEGYAGSHYERRMVKLFR